MAAIPMIELWRGGILESLHAGHAVICDERGEIVEAWGDPEAVIFPRSSCKMMQALPLIESGAAAAHGLTDAQLALACASHDGAAIHTGPVESWLKGIGLGEPDLRCGPQMPDDREARKGLICSDTAPCQLHNNCSGKHAGFLTLNKHLKGGRNMWNRIIRCNARSARLSKRSLKWPRPVSESTAVRPPISQPRCMGWPARHPVSRRPILTVPSAIRPQHGSSGR